MTTAYIGKPTSRVDGPAKVTGRAKYAGEYNVPGLVYGAVVSSTAAKGRILRIDAAAATALPGVLRVLSHENNPLRHFPDRSYGDEVAPPGSPFRAFFDDAVRFSGQPIALVVAETFELARHAASLVRVDYACEPHATDLEARLDQAYVPPPREVVAPPRPPRGTPEEALAAAAVRHDAVYLAPIEHHNPMEPFATTVVREHDGRLTVYDKTQGVRNVHGYLSSVFGLSPGELRVLSPFVGGAFGSGLRPQVQVFLAVLAARELGRSVRVSLTRQQNFALGHRPATRQRVALGASPEGKLEAIVHEAVAETSTFEDYSEAVVQWSGMLYRCDNVKVGHEVVKLDFNTPCDMRAPGAAWGLYALECAMDELAIELGIDPLELRLGNYAERDQNGQRPFSSKELRACYQQAAERFGWARRDPRPGSMRDGERRVGWGLATGVWEALQIPAAARAVFTEDGRLTVSSATSDIGPGTYTIMTQLAAELLGLPLDAVTFKLGDSSLPSAPVQGGSFTAASVGSAVKAACDKVKERLLALAQSATSPLGGAGRGEVSFADGRISLRSDPKRFVPLTEGLARAKLGAIVEEGSAAPAADREAYGCYTHSAVFAEVKVDPDLGTTRVTRVVSAVAAGRILNPKTARSQIVGGVVGGIGMALEEESVVDHAIGRIMSHNLADYHVPVHADVPDIDVIFVDEHDERVNPLGAKGLGEIGIIGVAAAIANAVYHATGKRIRSLPITPDKLL